MNKLADYSVKQMEYYTIRAGVLARVSTSKLAENSEQRQVAMKAAQEVAMRAYARVGGGRQGNNRYQQQQASRSPVSNFAPKLYDGRYQGNAPKFQPLRPNFSKGSSSPPVASKLTGGQVPCNNCGAGSALSNKPWHLTANCPYKCTVPGCSGPPHIEGCPRNTPPFNGASANTFNVSLPGSLGRFERHPQLRALQRAHAAVVAEVDSIDRQIAATTVGSEDSARLLEYKAHMDTELTAVSPGEPEAAFVAAVALGEVDPNFTEDANGADSRACMHTEEEVPCHDTPSSIPFCAKESCVAQRVPPSSPSPRSSRAAICQNMDGSVGPPPFHLRRN